MAKLLITAADKLAIQPSNKALDTANGAGCSTCCGPAPGMCELTANPLTTTKCQTSPGIYIRNDGSGIQEDKAWVTLSWTDPSVTAASLTGDPSDPVHAWANGETKGLDYEKQWVYENNVSGVNNCGRIQRFSTCNLYADYAYRAGGQGNYDCGGGVFRTVLNSSVSTAVLIGLGGLQYRKSGVNYGAQAIGTSRQGETRYYSNTSTVWGSCTGCGQGNIQTNAAQAQVYTNCLVGGTTVLAAPASPLNWWNGRPSCAGGSLPVCNSSEVRVDQNPAEVGVPNPLSAWTLVSNQATITISVVFT